MVDRPGQVRYFPVQVSRASRRCRTSAVVHREPVLGPVEGRALGIGIDQQHGGPLPLQLAGKVQRDRRLAGAALLGQDGDDHGSSRAAGEDCQQQKRLLSDS
jgi:hypothetical protein